MSDDGVLSEEMRLSELPDHCWECHKELFPEDYQLKPGQVRCQTADGKDFEGWVTISNSDCVRLRKVLGIKASIRSCWYIMEIPQVR
jgi:hypothetical protein